MAFLNSPMSRLRELSSSIILNLRPREARPLLPPPRRWSSDLSFLITKAVPASISSEEEEDDDWKEDMT